MLIRVMVPTIADAGVLFFSPPQVSLFYGKVLAGTS